MGRGWANSGRAHADLRRHPRPGASVLKIAIPSDERSEESRDLLLNVILNLSKGTPILGPTDESQISHPLANATRRLRHPQVESKARPPACSLNYGI